MPFEAQHMKSVLSLKIWGRESISLQQATQRQYTWGRPEDRRFCPDEAASMPLIIQSDLGFLERPFAYVNRPGAHDRCEGRQHHSLFTDTCSLWVSVMRMGLL